MTRLLAEFARPSPHVLTLSSLLLTTGACLALVMAAATAAREWVGSKRHFEQGSGSPAVVLRRIKRNAGSREERGAGKRSGTASEEENGQRSTSADDASTREPPTKSGSETTTSGLMAIGGWCALGSPSV